MRPQKYKNIERKQKCETVEPFRILKHYENSQKNYLGCGLWVMSYELRVKPFTHHHSPKSLFPFDGRWRFRRNVVTDAIHALHLINNIVRHLGKELKADAPSRQSCHRSK